MFVLAGIFRIPLHFLPGRKFSLQISGFWNPPSTQYVINEQTEISRLDPGPAVKKIDYVNFKEADKNKPNPVHFGLILAGHVRCPAGFTHVWPKK